eukprot:gene266-6681_t
MSYNTIIVVLSLLIAVVIGLPSKSTDGGSLCNPKDPISNALSFRKYRSLIGKAARSSLPIYGSLPIYLSCNPCTTCSPWSFKIRESVRIVKKLRATCPTKDCICSTVANKLKMDPETAVIGNKLSQQLNAGSLSGGLCSAESVHSLEEDQAETLELKAQQLEEKAGELEEKAESLEVIE